MTPMSASSSSPYDSELAAVRAELARIDAKCSALVGLAGAATAFLATQVEGTAVWSIKIPLGCAGLVLASATIVLLVCVLRPRLGSSGFVRYSSLDEADIRQLVEGAMRASGPDRVAGVQAEDLRALSAICHLKYRRLRLAIDLSALGVVLIASGMVLGGLS